MHNVHACYPQEKWPIICMIKGREHLISAMEQFQRKRHKCFDLRCSLSTWQRFYCIQQMEELICTLIGERGGDCAGRFCIIEVISVKWINYTTYFHQQVEETHFYPVVVRNFVKCLTGDSEVVKGLEGKKVNDSALGHSTTLLKIKTSLEQTNFAINTGDTLIQLKSVCMPVSDSEK